ncbi:MAG: MarR family transcriptional regulator [Clostridia bacterium]|nr:MarR family transcriptional regulator [Clostridia bacterium]
MTDNREIINSFFVRIFNKILALEEHAIGEEDISVNEVHIIEAVAELAQCGESTMKNIAKRLNLSAGATSVAVNTLVNKGYLRRENGLEDRRKIFIFITEKAQKAEKKHQDFHADMIHSIAARLNEEELATLSKSLISLEEYFGGLMH